MKLGPEQNVNMPLKTVLSLITLVSIFTFSYFQITERLNNLETQDTLMQSDLLKKAEQTPKNLEIFMLIEELFKQTDKQQELLDNNIHTQIKLDHLETQLEKALTDIEKLKDKVRENGNSSYSANNVSW
jgi:multidrug resistance efflux pump